MSEYSRLENRRARSDTCSANPTGQQRFHFQFAERAQFLRGCFGSVIGLGREDGKQPSLFSSRATIAIAFS